MRVLSGQPTLIHQQKTCSLQSSIATWPLRLTPRKCIEIYLFSCHLEGLGDQLSKNTQLKTNIIYQKIDSSKVVMGPVTTDGCNGIFLFSVSLRGQCNPLHLLRITHVFSHPSIWVAIALSPYKTWASPQGPLLQRHIKSFRLGMQNSKWQCS